VAGRGCPRGTDAVAPCGYAGTVRHLFSDAHMHALHGHVCEIPVVALCGSWFARDIPWSLCLREPDGRCLGTSVLWILWRHSASIHAESRDDGVRTALNDFFNPSPLSPLVTLVTSCCHRVGRE
jgi:hypothetical protein